MFADSMLETSWAQRSRRSWSTMTSFGLQAIVLGFLLLLPVIRPVALPFLRPLPTPLTLAVPAGPPPVTPHPAAPRTIETNMLDNERIMMPTSIPHEIREVHDDVAPPPLGPNGPYVVGSTGPGGGPAGVLGAIGNSDAALPLPAPPADKPHVIRVSVMSEGDLLRKVQPIYPPLARSARIQGKVVLAAMISREGTIEKLHALEGHPMLIPAAIEAVRQWRYRPYILNHEPIEVETQITVNFTLSGN